MWNQNPGGDINILKRKELITEALSLKDKSLYVSVTPLAEQIDKTS